MEDKLIIIPLLYKVAHKCLEGNSNGLKKYGISTPQAMILGMIGHEFKGQDITQKDISNKLGIKESSVSSVIKTMIKNNLLTKEQSNIDARKYILKLTKKSNEMLEEIKRYYIEYEKVFLSVLDEKEKVLLENILSKLCGFN